MTRGAALAIHFLEKSSMAKLPKKTLPADAFLWKNFVS
jgi:hypothetical protein